MLPSLLAGLVLGALPTARAARPTDLIGTYSFDAEDVVESLDGDLGLVRVHYSTSGPNQTILTDADKDGVADFPEQVAQTAEAVLLAYESAGLELPLSEDEMGLDPLGGSYALDFYLVDFAGVGDGQFGVDTCQGGVCSGYMTMENDFAGYGYGSLTYAIDTLTSHETFHGVQFAYTDDMPTWSSEGTAMWAEYLYDPDSSDFMSWCGRYMQEPERTLYSPPAGSSTWEYGTGIWFAFLDLTLGSDTVALYLEELRDRGGADADMDALVAAIEAQGSTLEDSFVDFVTWNLGTGYHAGAMDSYPFAERLDEVAISKEGDTLVDDERVYPLATAYLRLDHPGGPLLMGFPDDPSGLYIAVHPGDEYGPVSDAIGSGWPDEPGAVLDFGEPPAGSYFVIISQPGLGDGGSIGIDYCLGDDATLLECELDASDTGDTGASEEPGGCSCATGSGGAAPMGVVFFLGLLGLVRRRD